MHHSFLMGYIATPIHEHHVTLASQTRHPQEAALMRVVRTHARINGSEGEQHWITAYTITRKRWESYIPAAPETGCSIHQIFGNHWC
jgi:hypothetical protein